ncbi:MAG: hypothetical protein AAB538_02540 [Patescibacteria group bacterium]
MNETKTDSSAQDGSPVRSTGWLGIRGIAHTYCQAYPMPHGTKLTDMTMDDCLAAIQWKITSDHDIIQELQDENERRRKGVLMWMHKYQQLKEQMPNH